MESQTAGCVRSGSKMEVNLGRFFARNALSHDLSDSYKLGRSKLNLAVILRVVRHEIIRQATHMDPATEKLESVGILCS